MSDARAFRGFRFPAEVILWAVRWYLQFPVSYRDLERMLADRGVEVDHVSLYRWVQRFAPELEKRVRRHLRPCRGPWHVDETYVRVDGEWRYLGEFKWSSQHLDGGVCGGHAETTFGSVGARRVALARPARGDGACGPATVLDGDRGGAV